MLLSGCKGNTFFWKSTFFYGLIYTPNEKKAKNQVFTTRLNLRSSTLNVRSKTLNRRSKTLNVRSTSMNEDFYVVSPFIRIFALACWIHGRYFYPKYVKKNADIEYFPSFQRL